MSPTPCLLALVTQVQKPDRTWYTAVRKRGQALYPACLSPFLTFASRDYFFSKYTGLPVLLDS